MKIDEKDGLEPLPGQVLPQMICCGRANCRCGAGHLHGPYFYRIWREGTRVRKVYVKQHEVETVREQTRRYRAFEEELSRLASLRRALSKSLAQQRAIQQKQRSKHGDTPTTYIEEEHE